MNKFWVIVGQVYKKNVKSAGFLVMVLSPVVLLGIIAAIINFAENMEETPVIAVFTENQEVGALLEEQEAGFEVDPAIRDQAQAEQAMEAEDLDGYLTIRESGGSLTAQYVHTPNSDLLNLTTVTSLLNGIQMNLRAASLGLSAAEVTALLEPVSVAETTVTITDGEVEEGDTDEQELQRWTAYGICIAIFTFIMTYSSIIAEEIASEKGTRIMEIILSSVSSSVHFFGKLTAIFLIALTQLAAYAVFITVAWQLGLVQNLIPDELDLLAVLSGMIGITLAYFVIGILIYAVIAAFLGSLVTKIEDVSKSVTPIVFVALIGFYGGMFALINPTHLLVRIGSLIPLYTPFIMPFRLATDSVSNTELGISLLVMVLFAALMTWISLMLYRSNVLIYSDAGMWKTIQSSVRSLKNNRKTRV